MTNPLRKLWRAATPSSHPAPHKNVVNQPVGNELLMSDRRASKRHFYPLPAMVRYGVAASEQQVGIYNFSDQGLCFRSEVRFPVGAAVEITTTLPQHPLFNGRKVRYLAHVKRVTLERGDFIVGASIYRCETLAQPSDAAGTRAGRKTGSGNIPAEGRRTASLPATGRSDQRKTSKLKKDDGRQFSRYRCTTQAQFRTPGGPILSGEVANLSLGGCYVQTPEPYPVGASLELVMQVGRNRIYSQGRVTVVDEKQGMGVEFESNLRDCLQRLPRFVQVVSTGRRMSDPRKN